MKTIVYVDGYNLYIGRLKHTPYKWLDLYTLFNRQILHPQNPDIELLCVKYYTADILGKFASKGQLATQSQRNYIRALESPRRGPVEIIKGYYSASKSAPIRFEKPPNKENRVDIWKLEEKQTDVNIALDIYRDAVLQHCEQIVICTNDTDIVPALKRVKVDFPEIKIGVIFPLKANDKHRPQSTSLADLADWVRHHITDDELNASLFKDRIPTQKKPIDKPKYW